MRRKHLWDTEHSRVIGPGAWDGSVLVLCFGYIAFEILRGLGR